MRRSHLMIPVLAIAFFLSASFLSAQTQSKTEKNPFSFSVTGLRAYWLGIVPTGLDLKLDYRISPLVHGLDSILEMTAGAGYEPENFYRTSTGSPYTQPGYATAGPSGNNISDFDRVQAVSDLGFRQGILYNPKQNRNLLEAFAFYRFHYDHYSEPPNATGGLIFSSPFPDRNQILSNSIMGGFDYDTLQYDKLHKTYQGIYAETSLEWGPRFFFNGIGNADFLRWNFKGKIFRTLYTSTYTSKTAKKMNRFSLYAGEYFSADYATGNSIPIYVQQTLGGRELRFGLGGTVRGFETAAYDTNFKAVNSLEIRAVGPAIFVPSLAPGLFAFVDTGYYNGYFQDPSHTPGGFLASTGVGAYLVSFDLASIDAILAFPLYGHRIDRSPYNISFHFSLHF